MVMCLLNSIFTDPSEFVLSSDTHTVFVFLSAAVKRQYTRDISRVKANHFMKKI